MPMMYTCMDEYMGVFVYTHTYLPTYLPPSMHAYIHTYIDVYTHMHTLCVCVPEHPNAGAPHADSHLSPRFLSLSLPHSLSLLVAPSLHPSPHMLAQACEDPGESPQLAATTTCLRRNTRSPPGRPAPATCRAQSCSLPVRGLLCNSFRASF